MEETAVPPASTIVARPTPANRRRLVLLCVGFLAAFFAGDQILSHQPLVGVYGSRNGGRWKWELYRDTPRTPDVVFLGASYEMCGISPTVVDEAVGGRLHHPIFSLNLSASSSSLLTQSLMARRIVESGRLPKLVYFGISPPAVDDTLTHWMADGLRSLGCASDVAKSLNAPAPVLLEGVRTAMFASYAQWDDYRLVARLTALGAPLNPARKLVVDERGWANWTGGINLPPSVTGTPPLSPRGAEGVSESLVDKPPVAPDASLTSTVGRVRCADLSSDPTPGFDAGNVNDLALRECVAQLRGAGVQVRLVEIPHHSISRPRANPAKNLAYRRYAADLVQELGIALARPSAGFIDDGDFFDEWHLHADGAKKFSTWLAQDVAEALRGDADTGADTADAARNDENETKATAPADAATATFASRRPQSKEESHR